MTNNKNKTRLGVRRGIAIVVLSVILSIFLSGSTVVHAACYADEQRNNVDEIPCPEEPDNGGGNLPQPLNELESVFNKQKSGLTNFDNQKHELSAVDPGADIITSIIFKGIDLVKYVLGTVAVIFAIVTGIKLVTAGSKGDEEYEKAKTALKFLIYGLVIVIMADELVTKVFFGEYGECVASATNAKDCAKAGNSVIKGVYSLVMALMSSVAVLMIVISGFRMVSSAGNEDTIKKEKTHITYAVLGLLLAAVAEFIIKGIIFPDNGEKGINVAKAQELVFKFTNFIASFIGAAAFLMIIYGGYLYVVSFGDEDGTGKAKKVITSALIGILIAAAAFGIVSTISTLTRGVVPPALPGM